MWSRKKRKKEAAAAAAAGGGAKEGAGSSNGSTAAATTSTAVNAKLTLSDLSRSRSQSGSPVKEQHQQRSGSVGPSRNSGGGDGSSSLSHSQIANGSLQPASKPQEGGVGEPPPQPSLASQQHQLHNIPPAHGTAMPPAVVVPPPSAAGSNLKQYPLNQNHPPSLIPPTGGVAAGGAGGAVLPPQLHPHAPIVVNPPSSHPPRGVVAGEAPPIIQTQQLGSAVPAPSAEEGGGGVEEAQVKQAHKTLANPNIKPSLTVPLPTVPLSASILESLHDVASKVDATGTTAGSNSGSGGNSGNSGNGNSNAGGANTGPAISTAAAAAAQGQLKDPTNAMGAQGSTDGVGPPGVGVMVTSSSAAASQQQIQQVIDARRTQLALLSQQITQLVTEKNLLTTNPLQDSGGRSGGMMRGHISSMAPGLGGYPPKSSSIASRTQTFDYGNRSNKVLENAAVHQLEQDYYHGDQSGRNY